MKVATDASKVPWYGRVVAWLTVLAIVAAFSFFFGFFPWILERGGV